MEENGFQAQANAEQKRAQAEQISAIFEFMKTIDERIAKAVAKEVRKVREDLRNFDKLRPLREEKEEEPAQAEEVQQEITTETLPEGGASAEEAAVPQEGTTEAPVEEQKPE